jgi:hypothetical protein
MIGKVVLVGFEKVDEIDRVIEFILDKEEGKHALTNKR